MSPRVIVVGGGAAGLMAAGRAAELGAQVTLLEKTARVGNKLRLTGNGRCNLTHEGDAPDFLAHVPRNGAFLRNSLARFYIQDLRPLLSSLGVPTFVEPDGRVFPASNRAGDVVAALLGHCLSQGVQVRYESAVREILCAEGAVCGLRLDSNQVLEGNRIVLAAGGASYPQTGSTGDGYRLAGQLGHAIVPLQAGLVPLVTAEGFVPRLRGVSLRDVRVALYQEGRKAADASGEMLFTHYGVSGPAILCLSLVAAEALAAGQCHLCVDLVPSQSETCLDQHFQRLMARAGKSSYHLLLEGLMPRALADVVAMRSGIPVEQPMSQLTAQQRQVLCRTCKGFDLTIAGPRPLSEAMITLGGISVKEIDPRTMASRLVRGLYFAGEVIDVAGETGGYNLQIAFTTGYVAGECAAQAP